MATQHDVRRIALSLPDTCGDDGYFAFSVRSGRKPKGIAWIWRERVHPRKPRVLNPHVLAIRVADLDAKEMLLMTEPDKFFTEPHYDGYPAVLVRLAAVGRAELRRLLEQAWAVQAPKALLAKSKPSTRASSAC